MQKPLINTMLAMLFACTASTQVLTSLDTLALKVPEQASYSTSNISAYVKNNFVSDSARARALFVWVTNNISYDVERLRLMKNPPDMVTPEMVLKTRKAVCQGYSELFVELLSQCNIPAMMVGGFGRNGDGSYTNMPHAWVAAEISKSWWLFDPTWSSGVVENGRFTRRFSNRFYKVTPEEMIKHHMPFDPLHQFLNYPITANEFYDGVNPGSSRAYFNYKDTLKVHQAMDQIGQIRNTMRRIQANGVRNDLIRLELERHIRNSESFSVKTGLDSASNLYKVAIDLFNTYIKNKNERFASISRPQIQLMIDSVYKHIELARGVLETVVPKDDQSRKILYDMKNHIYQFSLRVDKENAFLKTYLGKG